MYQFYYGGWFARVRTTIYTHTCKGVFMRYMSSYCNKYHLNYTISIEYCASVSEVLI